MENKREVKIIAIVALLVAVVGLSVAYAALSTSLSINGTATINAASWQVKFVEGSWDDTKKGGATHTGPTVTATAISNLDVTLTKPGDKVVYNFSVANTGSIDAKLSNASIGTISCTGGATGTSEAEDACKNVVYTIKYADGGAVPAVGDTLTHGESKNLVLTIEFLESATTVPSEAVTINGINAQFIYEQA